MRIGAAEERLAATSALVERGGVWDRWDLDVRFGTLASAKIRVAVEEHGRGRQLVRDGAIAAFAALSGVAATLAIGALWDMSTATAAALSGARRIGYERKLRRTTGGAA